MSSIVEKIGASAELVRALWALEFEPWRWDELSKVWPDLAQTFRLADALRGRGLRVVTGPAWGTPSAMPDVEWRLHPGAAGGVDVQNVKRGDVGWLSPDQADAAVSLVSALPMNPAPEAVWKALAKPDA